MKKLIIIIVCTTTLITVIGLSFLLEFLIFKNTKFDEKHDLDIFCDFKIKDTINDGNNQKAKVVFLAGQSNATGISRVDYLKENISEDKFGQYNNGFDNVYINYFCDNGRNFSEGFEKVGVDMGCEKGYFGPELGMAEILSDEYDKVFIIKYSWSGSSLIQHWLGDNAEGVSMYDAFSKFSLMSLNYLISKNYDIDISAMCWMQGEGDCRQYYYDRYDKALDKFVSDMRNMFSAYDSEIAFIDAGISDSPLWGYYKEINTQKEAFSKIDDKNFYIDTIGQNLHYNQEPTSSPDIAHYDSLSMIKLGNLFAESIIDYNKK